MEYILGLGSAIWLGVLTSISPCPLATNIAAISFLSKNIKSSKVVFANGILYSIGRAFVYVCIALLVVNGVLSIPNVSLFLQSYMNKILGPLLIIVGMFLLGLLSFSLPGVIFSENTQRNVAKKAFYGPFLLGILFALSFCPVSAALFFGSLIPIAIKQSSNYILPFVYGVGTAVPVLLFSFLTAFGVKRIGQVFNKITQLEKWVRSITGVIFILVGIYYILTYIFEVL